MLCASKVEAAAFAVLELGKQLLGQPQRKLQMLRAPARLQQLQRRVEQESVIVEIGREARAAVLVNG